MKSTSTIRTPIHPIGRETRRPGTDGTADKRNWVRDDTHQGKQKDDGRRLKVRAESQQTAIAILHHELPLVPGHVAESASEFYALGCVLGIKCVGIFNGQV